jgi:hypothetical protein
VAVGSGQCIIAEEFSQWERAQFVKAEKARLMEITPDYPPPTENKI